MKYNYKYIFIVISECNLNVIRDVIKQKIKYKDTRISEVV